MATRRASSTRGSTGRDLRRLALALRDAVETITWGEPHFRVDGKIFAGLGVRDGRQRTSVKLEKAHAEARLLDPRFRPAPYVGRYGWVEFALGDVAVGELAGLVEESYRLVAGKRRAATKAPPRPARAKARAATGRRAAKPRAR